MKNYTNTLLILPITLCLSQCIVVDENGNIEGTGAATQVPAGQAGFSQPLSASTGQGTVTVREGGNVLSTFSTASPNVEQTRWYSEQEQIAVKSRGNHGPATVQLFDSRTGAEKGRVMAYDIKNGQPAWAASMAE
ncbi:hypothetical protein [Haloferula sp.]|uniref:hypothetical protein n=1 Tax=Haloferula sp. TaxID=2497595 RepID=UPI003C78E7AA